MPSIDVNGHRLHYEIHGSGEPLLIQGGWGTFCHGGTRHLPRGLVDRYQVVTFDYRGIAESTDDLSTTPSMKHHADDAIALLDHLGLRNVHIVGLVGMGACVGQEIAIARPDLARSLFNTGAWCEVDALLRDQLEILRDVHRDSGFWEFQKLVCVLSFTPDYYLANRDKLLGPDGGWAELRGRYEAHARLIEACVSFDSKSRLDRIRCPTLILHAQLDQVTSPRVTLPIERGIPGAEGVLWEDLAHVVAGREQKIRFASLLFDWLARN
jgi:3-oxoadipate enol-lactonase